MTPYLKRFLSYLLVFIVATSPLQASVSAIELNEGFHHDVVQIEEDDHHHVSISPDDQKKHCHIEFDEQAHCHSTLKLSDSAFNIRITASKQPLMSRLNYFKSKASIQSQYPKSLLRPPRT